MKVVLDANVLVRAGWSAQGPAADLLDRLESSRHEIVASDMLLGEVDRILKSPRLRARHGLDDATIEHFVERIASLADLVVVPANLAAVVAGDPMDDHVIYAAQQSGADVICTRDQHLLAQPVVDYCRPLGIRVLTDLELLAELRAAGRGS